MLVSIDSHSSCSLDNDHDTEKNAHTIYSTKDVRSGTMACIVESRGNATEVGVGILDSQLSLCHAYQFMDTPSFELLQKIFDQHNVTTVLFKIIMLVVILIDIR